MKIEYKNFTEKYDAILAEECDQLRSLLKLLGPIGWDEEGPDYGGYVIGNKPIITAELEGVHFAQDWEVNHARINEDDKIEIVVTQVADGYEDYTAVIGKTIDVHYNHISNISDSLVDYLKIRSDEND